MIFSTQLRLELSLAKSWVVFLFVEWLFNLKIPWWLKTTIADNCKILAMLLTPRENDRLIIWNRNTITLFTNPAVTPHSSCQVPLNLIFLILFYTVIQHSELFCIKYSICSLVHVILIVSLYNLNILVLIVCLRILDNTVDSISSLQDFFTHRMDALFFKSCHLWI